MSHRLKARYLQRLFVVDIEILVGKMDNKNRRCKIKMPRIGEVQAKTFSLEKQN